MDSWGGSWPPAAPLQWEWRRASKNVVLYCETSRLWHIQSVFCCLLLCLGNPFPGAVGLAPTHNSLGPRPAIPGPKPLPRQPLGSEHGQSNSPATAAPLQWEWRRASKNVVLYCETSRLWHIQSFFCCLLLCLANPFPGAVGLCVTQVSVVPSRLPQKACVCVLEMGL